MKRDKKKYQSKQQQNTNGVESASADAANADPSLSIIEKAQAILQALLPNDIVFPFTLQNKTTDSFFIVIDNGGHQEALRIKINQGVIIAPQELMDFVEAQHDDSAHAHAEFAASQSQCAKWIHKVFGAQFPNIQITSYSPNILSVSFPQAGIPCLLVDTSGGFDEQLMSEVQSAFIFATNPNNGYSQGSLASALETNFPETDNHSTQGSEDEGATAAEGADYALTAGNVPGWFWSES